MTSSTADGMPVRSASSRAACRAPRRGCARPPPARAARSVSIHTDSAWPTTTGTRTQRRADRQVGELEDLARLLAELRPPRRTRRRRTPSPSRRWWSSGSSAAQLVERLGAGTGDRLVRGDDESRASPNAQSSSGAQRHHQADGRAVRVRDQRWPRAPEQRTPLISGTTSGTPSSWYRNADDLSTQSAPAARGDRHELAAPRACRSEKKQTSRSPAPRASSASPPRRSKSPSTSTRGAPRGERADVRVAAIDEVLERDPPDGAGSADDADTRRRIARRCESRPEFRRPRAATPPRQCTDDDR